MRQCQGHDKYAISDSLPLLSPFPLSFFLVIVVKVNDILSLVRIELDIGENHAGRLL